MALSPSMTNALYGHTLARLVDLQLKLILTKLLQLKTTLSVLLAATGSTLLGNDKFALAVISQFSLFRNAVFLALFNPSKTTEEATYSCSLL